MRDASTSCGRHRRPAVEDRLGVARAVRCGSSPPPRRAPRASCRRGACGGARSARTRRPCRAPSTRRTRWSGASTARSSRARCTRRPAQSAITTVSHCPVAIASAASITPSMPSATPVHTAGRRTSCATRAGSAATPRSVTFTPSTSARREVRGARARRAPRRARTSSSRMLEHAAPGACGRRRRSRRRGGDCGPASRRATLFWF